MNVVQVLGALSDAVTERLVHSLGKSDRAELFAERMGFVRRAQLEAILATSRPMMLANFTNALALILVEIHVGKLTPATLIWALVVASYAATGWRRARLFYRSERRHTSGLRAPGKIALSSFALAVLWCYPVVFILPTGTAIEIAFVSALTSGMVAGGILALYPVPLAAIIYASTLWVGSFAVILFSDVLPVLPFAVVTAAFSYVALHSILRHAGMFLSELVEKLQAQRQSDITHLLMHAYQGAGGHYLWRCDGTMRLATDPAPLRRMLRVPEDTSPGANLFELLDAAGARMITEAGALSPTGHLYGLIAANRHFNVPVRLNDDRTVEFVGRPEALTAGYANGYHGYLKDVTQETRAAQKIKRLATRDAMTGLLNYREFRVRADAMAQEGCGAGSAFAFLFLDADNLKSVNDNFGHAIGDKLIIDIADRLATHLPENSLAARKGGDEFVALMRFEDPDRLQAWSDDLLAKICSDPSEPGAVYTISCCIGVAQSQGILINLAELELQADRALNQAKSNGKRQVRLYDDEIGQKLYRARVLETDFKPALAETRLFLDYQPIFDAHSLEALGTEALLRWTHPTFGDVPPEEIVSLARAESLNIQLLEMVVARAVQDAGRLPNQGFLSVNASPVDLSCHSIADRILDILKEAAFSPARLWLEITESEVLRNNAKTQKTLHKLRAAGVKIAIDDFGAGYSSLSRLETMPADVLKIDRELVRHCDKNASQQVILNALKTLSKIHGLALVAEGIETEEEIHTLKACDVDMLQGFVLARPMSADQIALAVTSGSGLLRQVSQQELAL